MATAAESTNRGAEEFLADARFHRIVNIPACDQHAELTISYADYGVNEIKSEAHTASLDGGSAGEAPVVLYMPGMYASRFLGCFMHFFARKYGVRLLLFDRFGFGKSTMIPAEKRVETWTRIVPKLLDAIGVKHVVLMSHSAGTVYLLDVLWHCRDILYPKLSQVIFLAPWVDVVHSDAPLMPIIKSLPDLAINYWNKFSGFLALHSMGAINASSGVLSKLSNLLSSGSEEGQARDDAARILELEYGLGSDFQAELSKLVLKRVLNDATEGAEGEVAMCLKRGPAGIWHEADDMRVLIDRILSREGQSGVTGQGKLSVKIYFSEADIMTGKAGQRYFESCWRRGDAEYDEGLNVMARVIPGTDHDSVTLKLGVLKEVFETIGRTRQRLDDCRNGRNGSVGDSTLERAQ